jgi:hypothetical protein
MKSLSTLDELRELLGITQQCMAQARIVQREAARYLSHHKVQAEEFIRQAAHARSPELQARFLRIAASYERLAQRSGALPQASSHATSAREARLDDEEMPRIAAKNVQQARRKPAENALAQAHRHVAQAENHVANQRALVERLSKDAKHVALAAEAKEILSTLEHTLILARQHLSLELNK